MKKIIRFLIYLLGLGTLSLGVILNTRTGYGVSPLNSMPYAVSEIFNYKLGTVTIVFYTCYVAIEMLLLGKIMDIKLLMQVPCGIIFGAYTNLFSGLITYEPSNHIIRTAFLVLAIFLTALGVVITVNMNLVPNPPDGLTDLIAKKLGKDFGFAKNIFDSISILVTIIICLVFSGHIIGIGVGTVVAVVMIGRTAAWLNKVLKEKLQVIGKW
ncbi:MAG TPA: hypothetical protein GXX75_20125 [Clostridiales bacterium]|nr:hypothetical protein [Clostridiales bacterium]